MDTEIKCPKCKFIFDISESLSLEIKRDLEAKYEQLKEDLKTGYQSDLNKEKGRMREHSDKLVKDAQEKAIEKVKKDAIAEQRDLQDRLNETAEKLEQAQNAELELRKQQRQLEESKRTFELEMTRKLDSERDALALKIKQEQAEEHRYVDMEKDKKLSDMLKQIEDLKQKAEQSSTQAQGEVVELDIEAKLRALFIYDTISEVAKGVAGADIIQTVCTPNGKECGKIIYEIKRTKGWNQNWIKKLKDDARASKVDIAIIVSSTLPDDIVHFEYVDGVWISSISTVLNLASAMRSSLIAVSKTLDINKGKENKSELLYSYFTGNEFKGRIQTILESIVTIQQGLEAEKRAMNTIWSKRQKEIERMVLSITGMRGDIEGISGEELPEMKILQLGEEK
jgi:hypothetical protein